MMTHLRDVVAAPDAALAFDEHALKQVAVLFNRIAFPGLTFFRAIQPRPAFAEHLFRLDDMGILFQPEIVKSDDQGEVAFVLGTTFLSDKLGCPLPELLSRC